MLDLPCRSLLHCGSSAVERRYYSVSAAPEDPRSSSGPKITIDYQRQRAREMTTFFNDIKRDSGRNDTKSLAWTRNNELNNGRWAMMGIAIGLLTEYATGVDFIDQIK